MPTPQPSPFIPPLPVPGGTSSSPHHPPVIPSPPGGGTNYPAWATTPQHPGNYPIYPSTPHASTPFIPPSLMTPAGNPGYLPPQFAPQGPPPGPHHNRNGYSMDYTGYPQPQYSGYGMTLHPPTPWPGPASAPLQPGAPPPWAAPRQAYPQFQQPPPQFQPQHPQFQHPQSAGAFPGAQWGGFTPGHPVMPDPWGQQMPQSQPPPWVQAQMMQPPPQMQAPAGPLGRASAHEGDRVDPFMSGDHYGPVLEPFLVRIVGAQIKINPLLQPVPDEADRPHLKWNMLFPSSNCQRSTDPSHISWVDGRHEPATFPRVSSLRLVSEGFPWMVKVDARRPETGVTCGDVIDRLSSSLYTLSSSSDYDALPPAKQRLIGEAYRHNRSRAHGVPGGTLETGMRRLDFLGKDTIFGGIMSDEEYLRRHAGVVLPCTFVLKCLRRFAMTAEEIRDHEARQRAAAAQNAMRASVTSDSDDDDDT